MLIRHIALLSAASLCLTAAEATELRITLHNVMPKQGEVLVTLFDQAKGFPDQPSTTQPSQRLRPDSSTLSLTFSNLPQGRWAVMVLQTWTACQAKCSRSPRRREAGCGNNCPGFTPPAISAAFPELSAQLPDHGRA